MEEASNQAIVAASTPPDPASDVESPLSTVLYDASQNVQAGMENLLKMITEIDVQSAEVMEEIEKCKENAHHRRKAIEDEKDLFQKAAYAVLDVLNINFGDGKPDQVENGHNY
ncbi:hypothetical protein V2J09_005255 [Rumex salicifolius]